ncbi:MAG: hypothetical protein EOO05_06830 [Chitinophagaceae bacterium]|nr:MAG: hypothetical protein EOO05_06830 [Chitinophagaceae bacterium]
MINKHLTDEEIQQYVLGVSADATGYAPDGSENITAFAAEAAMEPGPAIDLQSTVAHLDGCPACRTRVAEYRLLFTALNDQEPAVFGFDIAGLVLERMAEPVKRPLWMTVLFVILSLLGIAVPVTGFIIFRTALSGLFTGLAPLILPLAGTAVLTTLGLLLGDMYKQYRKKLALLEMN